MRRVRALMPLDETFNARADLAGVEGSLALVQSYLAEMGISGNGKWSGLRGRANVHLDRAVQHLADLRSELVVLGVIPTSHPDGGKG